MSLTQLTRWWHAVKPSVARAPAATANADPQVIVHLLGSFRVPRDPDSEGCSGVVRVALELARLQAQHGHRVTVACVGSQAWQVDWQGVTLCSLRPWRWARVSVAGKTLDVRAHMPFVWLTWRQHVDVVHGHLYYYLRGLRADVRVAHVHGDPLHRGMGEHSIGMSQATFALLERTVDGFIAVSRFIAERLRTGLTERANVHVVYNGVNLQHFALTPATREQVRTRWRSHWQAADAATVFVFVGAVVPEKGVLQLARAFATIEAERDDVHLVVIGSSTLWGTSQQTHNPHESYEAEVHSLLEPAAARGHVHVMGKVPAQQVADLLFASDVAVTPSLWQEPFGLVILEAFAAGLPVIASRVGGIPEVAVHGFHQLVPAGDEDALAAALEQAAQQPHWHLPTKSTSQDTQSAGSNDLTPTNLTPNDLTPTNLTPTNLTQTVADSTVADSTVADSTVADSTAVDSAANLTTNLATDTINNETHSFNLNANIPDTDDPSGANPSADTANANHSNANHSNVNHSNANIPNTDSPNSNDLNDLDDLDTDELTTNKLDFDDPDAARERVQTVFSWQRSLQEVMAVYDAARARKR